MWSRYRNNTPLFLRCTLYSTIRAELLDEIRTVTLSHANYPDKKLLKILLFGSDILVLRPTNRF